jgi:hypothetical protein
MILCSECPYAKDGLHADPREATVWWHRGQHDEKYVCKRCYQRLYMRDRRAGGQTARSTATSWRS